MVHLYPSQTLRKSRNTKNTLGMSKFELRPTSQPFSFMKLQKYIPGKKKLDKNFYLNCKKKNYIRELIKIVYYS